MKNKPTPTRLIQALRRPVFVLTALSSFAGLAQAQSTVEVFGLLDVGYLYTSASGSGSVSSLNPDAIPPVGSASGAPKIWVLV